MRRLLLLVLSLSVLALAAPAAQASVPHIVRPGETLWSIAAANNFSTRALAAANGLSEDSPVVLGTTIKIPTVAEATAAMQAAGMIPNPGGTTTAAPAAPGAPEAMGGYTVQPGDTLTGLAARSGVSVGQIAYMNGLAKDAQLLAGTVLKLPTGAPGTAAPGTTAPAQPAAAPDAPPYPTPVRVSAGEIAQIAAANGVPTDLATAIAWQESGFNNAMVSAANARGVMQVMPGTWAWIRDNLANGPLDPHSAHDNVRAGVLYLGSLLRDAGGDAAQATAGYYQGLGSVRSRGMLPETQQYVNNVLALRGRFGG
jgi:N-acetylmuramoyl-L-alanine amidase